MTRSRRPKRGTKGIGEMRRDLMYSESAKDERPWVKSLSRLAGVLLLLAGILLAAGLCAASPPIDNPVPSILAPQSTPADSIYHLSYFVLAITTVIFLVVFTLLTYVVMKFRGRATGAER